jgi:hypothetical protein
MLRRLQQTVKLDEGRSAKNGLHVIRLSATASGARRALKAHGFPDDARAWDEVAVTLAEQSHRVLLPYLRGCGPARFLDPSAPRMAQQAAISQDLLDMMDALAGRVSDLRLVTPVAPASPILADEISPSRRTTRMNSQLVMFS